MSAQPRYRRADVASRAGRAGGPIWIIYKDSVYDVTDYVAQHPGGDQPIVEEAGGDCSRAFDEVGHSGDARTLLAKYKIGELVDEERAYDANGKKIKRKVVATGEEEQGRSCLSLCTCGLL